MVQVRSGFIVFVLFFVFFFFHFVSTLIVFYSSFLAGGLTTTAPIAPPGLDGSDATAAADAASSLLSAFPPGQAANLFLGTEAATAAAAGSGGQPGAEGENDDDARGLPPHLSGALAPRMQHILHRSVGSNSTIFKAQQLIAGKF